ncbi:MAG: hypothetical protein SGJ21_05185 [Alphaproteobacteria bacterium]|nr:hypothetical protein [Alphaproteobacteria bacterium]
MTPRTFAFQTEFTPAGDIVGGADRKYFSRAEAEDLAAAARADAETRTRQAAETRGFASVDLIVGRLSPVLPQLVAIVECLRREAAELALVAARKIAGAALDAHGARTAADAIAHAVRLLKSDPAIIVSAAPEAAQEIERRMDQLRSTGRAQSISFEPDPAAQPGDWRIEWAGGAAGFNREDVEAAVAAAIHARIDDPVEPQLQLFSVA